MRLFSMIIWIVLIALGVSFAVLNSNDVPVNYFVGQKTLYFPLLVLILLFLGALIGTIAIFPWVIKLKTQIHHLKQKIKTNVSY